jgi:hypothetical protein
MPAKYAAVMPDAKFTSGVPAQPELVAVARACLAGGETLDQAARAILEHTQAPIQAIKALRAAQPDLSLADAKPIVHRNLPLSTQKAAEQLWDDVVRAVESLAD